MQSSKENSPQWKEKECDLLRRDHEKKLTKADKTTLRNIFKKIKVTDFLLNDYDFSDSFKDTHRKILQHLQKRLAILHYVFTFVKCAMRHEKNFMYREGCLNDVLEEYFSDTTLLFFFCDKDDFDTRFILMDLLCNFRRFDHDSIKMILSRVIALENTIHYAEFDYYNNRS